MIVVTAGSVIVLTAAAPVTVCVVAAAVEVKVIAAAVDVVVTRGNGKLLVQKLCAGAYEESNAAALYGWLEHAGKFAAYNVVADVRIRDEPKVSFMFATVLKESFR